MLVYTENTSPRLAYISHFVAQELYGQDAVITTDKTEFNQYTGPKINYSNTPAGPNELQICPHDLLVEKGISPQAITCTSQQGVIVFFQTAGELGFDILAASFYLISRYEEYLPHREDMYGRYAHENSLAYREGFLDQPLVNRWLELLQKKMYEKFPGIAFRKTAFQLIPTYDIDEAYCYLYKAWWRSAGAAVKDVLNGRWANWRERRSVLDRKKNDPFDAYSWMDDLHRPHPSVKPYYFFLVPARTGRYDRNILPSATPMQTLIQKHSAKYHIGIHPSWQSGDDPSLLKQEKETLERIAQQKILASRQHFIRFKLPVTYRQLLSEGIREDFSMGYGSINGFRASVASPFCWYDLEKESATSLRIFPFCFMDANAYYEQKATALQAIDEMRQYYEAVKEVNGTLITIWHNTFLGTHEKFRGWREGYRLLLEEIVKTPH